jgi:hypothetical protein
MLFGIDMRMFSRMSRDSLLITVCPRFEVAVVNPGSFSSAREDTIHVKVEDAGTNNRGVLYALAA